MIRHTNSFLISLMFHSFLLFLILYTVKTLSFDTQKKDSEIVCLKLCNVKPQNKKEPKVSKQPEAVVEKKVISPAKKETKTAQKTKDLKQILVSKKSEVKIEKKQEVVKEISTKTQELKEQPKKAVEAPALMLSDNKNNSSCNCKQECTCDSKQETQEMKNIRVQKAYMDENMQEIVRLLQENLYYPRSARRRGITGEVIVRFSLDTNGEVSFASVTSSKSEILSNAAIKTIEDLSGDFPKPKERLVLKLPINYNLK